MNFLNGYVFTIEKKNVPAVLVGDFNISLKKIKTYISNNFPNWYIAPLYVNKFTYAKGTRSSCMTMSSIMRLWQLILIKPRFALHFTLFPIINLFYFLETKLSPMTLLGLLKFLNDLHIFVKQKIQIFYHIIIFQS